VFMLFCESVRLSSVVGNFYVAFGVLTLLDVSG